MIDVISELSLDRETPPADTFHSSVISKVTVNVVKGEHIPSHIKEIMSETGTPVSECTTYTSEDLSVGTAHVDYH